MDGNDFNLITPVSSLQNLSRSSDVERRKERKRKGRQKRELESQDENEAGKVDVPGPANGNDPGDPSRLDFRA
jgi:hypothetical protein